MTDIIPPRTKESVISTSDLFSQDVDAFIVERGESTKQGIQDTPERPHIDTLAVTFVLDNLWSSVANGAARCHGLLVPHHLAETKVRDLDAPDAATANTRNELTLVLLFLVVWPSDRVLGWDNLDTVEQEVFWLDVSVNHASFFVKVSDPFSDLEYNMPGEVFAEVCQLDNLMEELSAFHN